MYKFLPEYQENVKHFNEDKCLYMEIKVAKAINVVEEFKKICGPYDPSYAKKTASNSIRALFGVNRVQNAVHSTELYEDSESELRIIFQC
jgi:nucleoside-diphosphate kinase